MADSGEFALVTSRTGKTYLSALRHCKSFGELACNDSKGCGGVIRVAPHALFPAPSNWRLSQRITPTGYLAVGLLADILARLLVRSYSLKEAIPGSLQQHGNREDIGETRGLIDLMLTLYQKGVLPPKKPSHCSTQDGQPRKHWSSSRQHRSK
ncbi:ADP-ribosylglycohydrolase family protein [Pseudomonas taeanensis]|uniref:ADP-ribosylglycohydrolase family protein n=1 Tax=Pseudomonas taeanensis TaxID=574962 RepID=UPI0019105768|nr:ADP-ribosylglycohydrolase family protein [Pseudomonas taeanensis]